MIDHTNLEELADPVLYDLEQASRGAGALAFYGALAQETGAPVLELACGTGRVAIPIAQQAHVQGGVVRGREFCRVAAP
jgi:hypothetical protein